MVAQIISESLSIDSALCMFFSLPFSEIQQSFKVLIFLASEHTLLKRDELLPAMITGDFQVRSAASPLKFVPNCFVSVY